MNLNQRLKYLGGLILLILIFSSGWLLRGISADSNIESLLKNHEIELQKIKVVHTRNSTLIEELEVAGANRAVLLDEIASLKSKPTEIRYITKVETIIVGEPTFVTTELPESHTFRTDIGLAVAEFSVEGENDQPEYVFDTADLKIEADFVIAEHDSALSLRITSDLEPGTQYEVPVDELNVKHIKEQKLFDPHVLLGGSISAGTGTIGLAPHVGLSLLHARRGLDLVQIRLGSTGERTNSTTGSESRFSIGLDPVLYNIGDSLPVLTNCWLGGGATIDTSGQLSGTLSFGAKL